MENRNKRRNKEEVEVRRDEIRKKIQKCRQE
jgi:hypothetical protein